LRNSEITYPQLAATPTLPAAGEVKVYAKTDGKLYLLFPDGSERNLVPSYSDFDFFMS
jgi:hypothetical protein